LGMLDDRLPIWMRVWGLSLAAAVLLFAVGFRMFMMAAVAGYLVFTAPTFILSYMVARRTQLIRDQMVGASIALANASRAGLSLAQGFETVAAETPAPLASELNRIVSEFQSGRPLPAAIADTKQRLNLDSFNLFAVAVLACLERGGKVTEALERIGRSLQENQRLERKLAADTSSGRLVVMVLAAFPFVFLIGMYGMDATTMHAFFSSFAGELVLFVVAVLVYLSVRWANRLLNIEA